MLKFSDLVEYSGLTFISVSPPCVHYNSVFWVIWQLKVDLSSRFHLTTSSQSPTEAKESTRSGASRSFSSAAWSSGHTECSVGSWPCHWLFSGRSYSLCWAFSTFGSSHPFWRSATSFLVSSERWVTSFFFLDDDPRPERLNENSEYVPLICHKFSVNHRL